MPLICFNLASVFRNAVELGLAVEDGLPVQELPGEQEVACWDAFHESRRFLLALERLTQVLTPGGAQDSASLRRAIDLSDHQPPVRKALRTLVNAITAMGDQGPAKEQGRAFLRDGALRLWKQIRDADREAIADLLPCLQAMWGWPERQVTATRGSATPGQDSNTPNPPEAPTLSAANEASVPRLTRKEKRRRWVAEAMILIQEHPDGPDATIARAVEIDPSRLSRCETYQQAKAIAKRKRSDPPPGHVNVDPETRRRGLEAYSAGDDPAEMDWDNE